MPFVDASSEPPPPLPDEEPDDDPDDEPEELPDEDPDELPEDDPDELPDEGPDELPEDDPLPDGAPVPPDDEPPLLDPFPPASEVESVAWLGDEDVPQAMRSAQALAAAMVETRSVRETVERDFVMVRPVSCNEGANLRDRQRHSMAARNAR